MPHNSDEYLQAQIDSILTNDKDINSYGLKADVTDGEVRIEGVVDTLQEKQRLDEVLRGTPGVTKVANAVSISTDGRLSSDDVTMEVEEELELSRQVDLRHIGAESIGGHGTVILRGRTDDPAELQAALESASKARGVTRVLNQVKVGPKKMTYEDAFHSQVNNDRED